MLVPIANFIMIYFLLSDIKSKAGRVETPEPWLVILLLIPLVNMIVSIYIPYKIQEAFNKLKLEVF